MKKTTFYFTNTNSINNNFSTKSHADYSKILDDLIADNIKASNPYLNISSDNSYKPSKEFIDMMLEDIKPGISNCSKEADDFIKAANFLKNYSTKKCKKMPFILGKTYKLSNGSLITFYEDEIQIDMDLYSYNQFGDTLFLKKLTPETKKTILSIYTKGADTININL